MSLLDTASQFIGGQQGGNSALLTTVLSMVNSHPGGLSGLVQSFEQQGLGGAVSSWIGTGGNQPVSADQIQSVLGNQQVQAVASKFGISTEAASAKIAELLPCVVDHLTPSGQVPAGGTNLLEMGESLVKKFCS